MAYRVKDGFVRERLYEQSMKLCIDLSASNRSTNQLTSILEASTLQCQSHGRGHASLNSAVCKMLTGEQLSVCGNLFGE
jgi:hypothetical protein